MQVRGSWSPGPGTTGDTVTHRREADPHPQLPAAADIIAIQITRVRAKYFYPAPCEDVAAWTRGGPPPSSIPTSAQTLQQQQQQQQRRRWCGVQRRWLLVPIFPRAVDILRTIAGRMDASSPPSLRRRVSSHVSCIIYGVWGVRSYLHLSPASAG